MRRWHGVVLLFTATCGVFAQTPGTVENGKTIAVDGARIYHHILGSRGPHLIVVNGGPGFDHNYLHASPVWHELAANRRIVFYDQRGNGRSPADNKSAMDLAAQVQDLESLRASLGVDRIDLLGHSWGGYLAMAYAARHPKRIASLVIVDSAAPRWSDTLFLFDQVFPETTEAQRQTEAAQARGDQKAVDASIRLYLSMLFYSPEKRDAFLANASQYHFNKQVNEAVGRDLATVDLNPELGKFAFATLVMTGRFDINVAPLTAYKIHQAVPGSTFVVFERSGHIPFYEEPKAFLRELNAFLKVR
jgi:proline iminopeptidase